MPKNKFSLRKRKLGAKRFEIMQILLKRLVSEKLTDIHVESICEEAEISKVTFFNYFRSKEDVIHYYIMMWLFNLSFTISQQTFSGIDGILNIFKTVSQEKNALNLQIAIVQYLIKVDGKVDIIDISSYEYYLFHQEAYNSNTTLLTLNEIFCVYLEQLSYSNDEQEQKKLELITIFYGIPLTILIKNKSENLYHLYERMVIKILSR